MNFRFHFIYIPTHIEWNFRALFMCRSIKMGFCCLVSFSFFSFVWWIKALHIMSKRLNLFSFSQIDMFLASFFHIVYGYSLFVSVLYIILFSWFTFFALCKVMVFFVRSFVTIDCFLAHIVHSILMHDHGRAPFLCLFIYWGLFVIDSFFYWTLCIINSTSFVDLYAFQAVSATIVTFENGLHIIDTIHIRAILLLFLL